jgi:hypothetical protein
VLVRCSGGLVRLSCRGRDRGNARCLAPGLDQLLTRMLPAQPSHLLAGAQETEERGRASDARRRVVEQGHL